MSYYNLCVYLNWIFHISLYFCTLHKDKDLQWWHLACSCTFHCALKPLKKSFHFNIIKDSVCSLSETPRLVRLIRKQNKGAWENDPTQTVCCNHSTPRASCSLSGVDVLPKRQFDKLDPDVALFLVKFL